MVKYYYAGGTRVAMRTGTGEAKWLLGDHLGSTSVVANYAGTLYAGQGYKAWGEQRYSTGITPLPTTFRYTGQRESASFGLYYYGARWYDTALGRFVQADTVIPLASQGVQAWDRYAYVNNNPIRYVDSTGNMLDDGCRYEGCDTERERQNDKSNPIIERLKAEHEREKESANGERNHPFQNSPLDPDADYWNWWIHTYLPNGGLIIAKPALILGIGGNGANMAPNINATGGIEIIIFPDGSVGCFNYQGVGGAIGEGASGSLYGGLAFNANGASDIVGGTYSVGTTVSAGEKGITGNYFQSESGNVEGAEIGYAPGAQLSGWTSYTIYQEGICPWMK